MRSVPGEPLPESFLPVTPAVFHILLALADGASHGYAIMREVEAISGGVLNLGPGTLYRSMQRMLVDGLIVELAGHVDDSADEERRRRYKLTPLGSAVARAEAARLVALVVEADARGLLRAPLQRTAVRAIRSKGR